MRARLRAAAPARRLRVPHRLRRPAVRRPGHERAAAYVAGLLAADSLFELDADLLALATELEGHPDNAAAALLGGFVLVADGQATRLEVPAGLEALLVVPEHPLRTASARAALPAEVPMADAVFNVAHAGLLVLGLVQGRWDLVARGLAGPAAPAAPRVAVPALDGAGGAGAELGALGATISGAGPTVLVWTQFDATGGVVESLKAETEGWASVLRVPFEPQGADVRSLSRAGLLARQAPRRKREGVEKLDAVVGTDGGVGL